MFRARFDFDRVQRPFAMHKESQLHVNGIAANQSKKVQVNGTATAKQTRWFINVFACILRLCLTRHHLPFIYSTTMMNTRILSLLALILITLTAQAQAQQNSSKILIGAYMHAKAGVNTTVAQGWKTGPALSGMPDIGVSSMYKIADDGSLSVGLDLGYNSASYESQFVETNIRIHEQYSYVALFPHLNYKSFVLGVSYDIPVTGSGRDIDKDTDVSMVSNRSMDEETYLASVPSIKTGLRLPLMINNGSVLNLDVMASYALGGLFSDGRDYIAAYDYDGLKVVYNSAKNPTPAGISIGLSYQLPVK